MRLDPEQQLPDPEEQLQGLELIQQGLELPLPGQEPPPQDPEPPLQGAKEITIVRDQQLQGQEEIIILLVLIEVRREAVPAFPDPLHLQVEVVAAVPDQREEVDEIIKKL